MSNWCRRCNGFVHPDHRHASVWQRLRHGDYWWKFGRKRHCPHVHLRGIYGDEINHTPGYRRNQCLDCGRLLDGPVSISVERP